MKRKRLTGKQDINAALGEDLLALIREMGSPVAEVFRLTTHFSDSIERGSYKITLADGKILKARRFPRTEDARMVSRLSKLTDKRRFPKVLSSSGKSLLTEWIEGKALCPDECGFDRTILAAKIQAGLHSSKISGDMFKSSYSRAQFWRNFLEKKILNLVEITGIDEDKGKRLLTLARIDPDSRVTVGLAHGDYCLENMILDTNDSLRIVDIEGLSISALAHDLARTTIRWPLAPENRKAYLKGYGMSPAVEEFFRDFAFWLILALVESALFFAQGQMACLKEQLDSLLEISGSSKKEDLLARYGYRKRNL